MCIWVLVSSLTLILSLLIAIVSIVIGILILLLDPITYPLSSSYKEQYCSNTIGSSNTIGGSSSSGNDNDNIIGSNVNYDTINGECYFSSNYYEARETL